MSRFADAPLPRGFGRYRLIEQRATGGMGEIFVATLGEIPGFEKRVVIKKIRRELGCDDELTRRFFDEARLALALHHANIASVFEVGRVDDEPFLAMEYVDGRDLCRVSARARAIHSRLAPAAALFIVRELLSGLAYAHRRTDEAGRPLAVVHCDVSLPNVMVSFEGEVKMIDFGIAQSILQRASTNPAMSYGKLGYMAPEQLQRGGVVDRRTDVYSAGVVLYELLTGEPLFQFPLDWDDRQKGRSVIAGKIDPPTARNPRLPADFDPLLLKALSNAPEDRYQSAGEFRDAIERKLAQLNPPNGIELLARTMRSLFQAELVAERSARRRRVCIGEPPQIAFA